MSSDMKSSNPKDRAATHRLDLTLFPQTAIAYGALAMVEGDAKYGGYNYRVDGVSASTYIAAAMRHIMKWYNGEATDSKTKVHHLGSALACLAIIIDGLERRNLIDDRPPYVDMNTLLTDLEKIVEHLHKIYPEGPPRHTLGPGIDPPAIPIRVQEPYTVYPGIPYGWVGPYPPSTTSGK